MKIELKIKLKIEAKEKVGKREQIIICNDLINYSQLKSTSLVSLESRY